MDYDDEYGPSKTSLKKEADKAQMLGTQLVAANEAFLHSLQLDEALLEAIMLAKRIRQHGGKRRQIQRVGKLMRRADIAAIETALAEVHSAKAGERDQHHRAERLRDQLIASRNAERERLLASLPTSNKELLRLLKETDHYEQGSPAYKKASRNVFRTLLTLLG